MLGWDYSGFSLDAGVRIEAEDRGGLERLIRYCARPVFASGRLERAGDRLRYILPKPNANGEKVLFFKPFELLDRLAKLIPPPRYHRHLYHGVLASNAPLRPKIRMLAGKALTLTGSQMEKCVLDQFNVEKPHAHSVNVKGEEIKPVKISFGWASLIARIYEVLPLICPKCGENMRIISFIEDGPGIQKILTCLDESIKPPCIAPARGPPEMEFNYDQRCEYEV